MSPFYKQTVQLNKFKKNLFIYNFSKHVDKGNITPFIDQSDQRPI